MVRWARYHDPSFYFSFRSIDILMVSNWRTHSWMKKCYKDLTFWIGYFLTRRRHAGIAILDLSFIIFLYKKRTQLSFIWGYKKEIWPPRYMLWWPNSKATVSKKTNKTIRWPMPSGTVCPLVPPNVTLFFSFPRVRTPSILAALRALRRCDLPAQSRVI